ncbi:cold shock domain-containing protein [Marinomonas atlantica]|uniref:cold shock domain-containing protein n=1 Tax=Marinomonas atlantica TaxID=1806668 RepID=UPI000834706A|nr:cold shock domain-containing protein [Marinomonas atlantica]MCO4786279.1 cold shock domain-containing protein [Marinomonas atlantica]
MHRGSVKWFNNAKGYGFIVSDSFDEDLFIHYSAINVEGYKTLKAGQTVTFDTSPGKRGLHAVEITPVGSEANVEEDITESA